MAPHPVSVFIIAQPDLRPNQLNGSHHKSRDFRLHWVAAARRAVESGAFLFDHGLPGRIEDA